MSNKKPNKLQQLKVQEEAKYQEFKKNILKDKFLNSLNHEEVDEMLKASLNESHSERFRKEHRIAIQKKNNDAVKETKVQPAKVVIEEVIKKEEDKEEEVPNLLTVTVDLNDKEKEQINAIDRSNGFEEVKPCCDEEKKEVVVDPYTAPEFREEKRKILEGIMKNAPKPPTPEELKMRIEFLNKSIENAGIQHKVLLQQEKLMAICIGAGFLAGFGLVDIGTKVFNLLKYVWENKSLIKNPSI